MILNGIAGEEEMIFQFLEVVPSWICRFERFRGKEMAILPGSIHENVPTFVFPRRCSGWRARVYGAVKL